MVAPRGGVALSVDIEHGQVRHEVVWRRTVPVMLAGLEEHAIAGSDDLDLAAATLRDADPFDAKDGLTVRVRVPRGTSARREMNAARSQPRRAGRDRNGVDVNRAGEPLARSGVGLNAVLGDLHDFLLCGERPPPPPPLIPPHRWGGCQEQKIGNSIARCPGRFHPRSRAGTWSFATSSVRRAPCRRSPPASCASSNASGPCSSTLSTSRVATTTWSSSRA